MQEAVQVVSLMGAVARMHTPTDETNFAIEERFMKSRCPLLGKGLSAHSLHGSALRLVVMGFCRMVSYGGAVATAVGLSPESQDIQNALLAGSLSCLEGYKTKASKVVSMEGGSRVMRASRSQLETTVRVTSSMQSVTHLH